MPGTEPAQIHRARRTGDRTGAAALTYGGIDGRHAPRLRFAAAETEFLIHVSNRAVRADVGALTAPVAHIFVGMGNAGICFQMILYQQPDDLGGACGSLGHRLRNIFGPLTYAGQIYARRGAFYGAELGMRLGEEIIGVDARRQKGGHLSHGRLRFDRGRQNHEVGGNRHLLVVDKIRALHHQLAVFVIDLADHALDIIHAVLFHRAAVKLVVILSGGTHVDIEHVHLGVGIFFPDKHGVLRRVHAADLGAVGLALLHAVTAGADALDEDDGLRVCAVGRAQERAARRARGVHEALKFQARDDVRALAVGEFIEFGKVDGVEARRGDDGAVFLLDEGVGLLVVDRAGGTDLCAHTALAVFEHVAVVRVDGRDLRHGLCEGDIDGAAVVHAEVEFVRDLFLRRYDY